MLQMIVSIGRATALAVRGHRELVLENLALALRQQLRAMRRVNTSDHATDVNLGEVIALKRRGSPEVRASA